MDKKRWMVLVFAPLFLVSLGMISHDAFAMGPPPGSCNNEYNAQFTNATITVGDKTYWPLKDHVYFQLDNNQTYQLTYTIKVASQSNQGNTLPGSYWFDSDVLGYPQSECSNSVNPNQNVTFSGTEVFPRDYNPDINNNVTANFIVDNIFSYTIYWTVPTPAPSAPQNLQATAGDSQVDLSWAVPSSDGSSAITGYNIYRGTVSGGEDTTPIATVNDTTLSYTDTGLTDGQTYYYKVTAVNSVGESARSNEASAKPAAPATAPQPPTGLEATAVTMSQINLSWTAPSDDGGAPITGYMIERATGNGAWVTIVHNTGNTGTTYSDTGLASNTTYNYRVSAINSVGTSSPSNTASAITPILSVAGISVGPVIVH